MSAEGSSAAAGHAAGSHSADVPWGTVLIAGSVAHSMAGRKEPPVAYDGVPETNLYNFHVISTLKNVKVRAVITGPNASHYFAITVDGALYAWGRNERGQLGLNSLVNIYVPTIVPGLPPVKAVSAGKSHTLVLTEAGDVFAAGDNKMGQCSLGKGRVGDAPQTKFARVAAGLPAGTATGIAAGGDFSVAIAEGRLYSTGSQQYGQCGTGTDGVYIVAAGRTAVAELPVFEPIPTAKVPALAGVHFAEVAAGQNHCIARTMDGRIFSWGWGAYGRCGHGGTADVLVPTPVKFFEQDRMRVRSIYAGAQVSFGILSNMNQVYYFGISKKSGEAAMTPKHIVDITSLNPTDIAAGPTSTILAFGGGNAGNPNQAPMLVAFGPSPTSGELGFGEENKSSTKPKEVEDLTGCRVLDVAMGTATALLLVDTRPGAGGSSSAEGAGAGAGGQEPDLGSAGGLPNIPKAGEANPAAEHARQLIADGKIKMYTPVQPDPALAGRPKPATTSLPGMGAHPNDKIPAGAKRPFGGAAGGAAKKAKAAAPAAAGVPSGAAGASS